MHGMATYVSGPCAHYEYPYSWYTMRLTPNWLAEWSCLFGASVDTGLDHFR